MKFSTVDEYLGSFAGETRARLEEFRTLAQASLGDAEEGISYNIPAYRFNGVWVVYFSGYAKHVSLALGGRIDGIVEVFADDLQPYKTSAAAIQFPHTKPLPADLIGRLIEFRKAQTKP